MATFACPRRKPCRFFSVRNILLAVPTVWIIIILWTLYNAQSVLPRLSRKHLSYNDIQSREAEVKSPDQPDDAEIKQTLYQHVYDRDSEKEQPGGWPHAADVDDDKHLNAADSEEFQVQQKDNDKIVGVGDNGQEPNADMQFRVDVEGEWPLKKMRVATMRKLGRKNDIPLPQISPDFLFNKTQPSGMRFVQPDAGEWDAPADTDHVEFMWAKMRPRPKRKQIVPGNRFDPPKLGEYGQPVIIRPEDLSPTDRANYESGWKNHQFNEYISLQISTQREVPDYRPNGCKSKRYSTDLPKASIIICFYNEAWSVLLRTIHSVFSRSPPELIAEVILVDDFSDMVTMHESLEYYVAQVDKLRLIRMTKRSGLVRARLAGVQEAKGPVLLFLDSHVECAEGWLEPLLETIWLNPKSAVTPEIDVIDHKNFAIQAAVDNIGVLEFISFSFTWANIMPRILDKKKSDADPIESPTMAGGLFAIRKDYFLSLGTYDPGLELWGGENIELSLKLWMCGGGIMILPCSRVAHIFRDNSPYLKGNTANVIVKNSARVAEVWADEYRNFYFQGIPYDEEAYGSVEERKKLRSLLQCKSFSWYLDNIYPEMYIEGTGRYRGKISNGRGLCIHKTKTETDSPLILTECNKATQWEFSRIKEIRFRTFCMDRKSRGSALIARKCDLQTRSQVFEYTPNKNIYHTSSSGCLTDSGLRMALTFQPCTAEDRQRWIWSENPNFIRQSHELR